MASITINEVENALKTLLDASGLGLAKTFEDWPDEFQRRELPALVFSPRTAAYDERSEGQNNFTVRRQWIAVLLAKEAAIGREFQSESEVKPFLTSIPDYLEAYPRVDVGDGRRFGLEMQRGSDDGSRTIMYNEKPYMGSIFRFFVITTTRITPA